MLNFVTPATLSIREAIRASVSQVCAELRFEPVVSETAWRGPLRVKLNGPCCVTLPSVSRLMLVVTDVLAAVSTDWVILKLWS